MQFDRYMGNRMGYRERYRHDRYMGLNRPWEYDYRSDYHGYGADNRRGYGAMDFDFMRGRRSQVSPTFGARGSAAASTTATPYSSRNGEHWYQRNRRGLGSIGRATTSTLPSTYAPRPHSRDYYRGYDDYWRW